MTGTTTGMTRWDADRSRKASHEAYAQPRTCIHCHRDCRPRYLYCTNRCSELSRDQQRATQKPTT